VSGRRAHYELGMNQVRRLAIFLSLITACGAQRPEPASAPLAPAPEPAPLAVSEAPPAPAAVTPEEQARAARLAELELQRAKMLAEHELEVQRFTPDLKAKSQALAEKSYPSARAALSAVLKSPHRKPSNVERDGDRHPQQTLEFLGFRPDATLLEYGPGEGWYTEILAPALAKRGKLLATSADPNGPPEAPATFYAQRFKTFLETSPELYGKVETVIVDNQKPVLPDDLKLDNVLLFRGMHGMFNAGTLEAWLAAFHRALKPKGVLGVEQHCAAPDADPALSAKQGYLPEAWVIAQVEAAGFKLAGKSEINANPKDTRDHPSGVWSLPPSFRGGDQDREKYAAIGESDRMTLKFVKVEKKQ
jgi:predicted methyltransferase